MKSTIKWSKEQDKFLINNVIGCPFSWNYIKIRYSKTFNDNKQKHNLQNRYYYLRDQIPINERRSIGKINQMRYAVEIISKM